MNPIETFLAQIYLFAIVVFVSKPYVHTHVYRVFRLVAALFIAVFFARVFTGAMVVESWPLFAVQSASLLLILFVAVKQEVKNLLMLIGVKSGLLVSNAIEDEVKDELLHSVNYLSRHKIGALITFERSDSLEEYIKHSFIIDAPLSSELLSSIFIPNTPLHDGAVIIKENIIKSAGAYFPSSDHAKVPKYLGSRHRAAIGISEKSDSLTIVVSEQTGEISVAIEGYLDQDISRESLVLYLERYLQN